MRIDLSCPAEILRIEPPTKENQYGILTLFNMDSRVIVSCEVTLRLIDAAGREQGRAVHRARALTGRPRTAFLMSVPMGPADLPVHGEATLDKVWFEDNDVWRKNASRETEYESNALAPGNALNALKFAAGEDAVGFPSQQAKLWVCVCGRPNDNREEICVRCQRPKQLCFSRFNQEEVERILAQRERQLNLESRVAREEDIRLQRLREEEYNREQDRIRRRRRMLAALICGLAVCAAVLFGVMPGLRLLNARRQMENGQYEDARAVLTELGGFPGAAGTLAECELKIARRDAVQSHDPETLEAASKLLRDAGEAEWDGNLADKADFARAAALLENGDPEAAEALLNTLPEDYPGRAEQLQACTYAKAEAALGQREYENARELFISLGDYRDAAEQAKECLYAPALQLMESGSYDDAIALLAQIPGYEDSEELIRKCHFLKGYVLEMSGDTEAARTEYLAAGDYEDAKDRACAILKAKADALKLAGNYMEAIPLYRELDGYLDCREQWFSCALSLGNISYRAKEYHQAVEVLDALPEEAFEYEELAELRTKSVYQAAKADAKREDYEAAIALMERIPDYKDAKDLLNAWRYALSEQLMDEEKWEEAEALLIQLGDYKYSRRRLKQVQQKIAEASAPTETPVPEGTPAPAETDAPEETAAAETDAAETNAAATDAAATDAAENGN